MFLSASPGNDILPILAADEVADHDSTGAEHDFHLPTIPGESSSDVKAATYLIEQTYTPRQGPVRRSFSPKGRRYGKPTFSMDKLVKYSPKYGYSRLFYFPRPGLNWQPRMNTIVIQVHGIASPNATSDPDSVATAGVYFGQGSPRNMDFVLPKHMEQTNNKAVLEAIRSALNAVVSMRHTVLDPRRKEVIILTNSDYAKKSLSEWVWSWERNGWNHMQNSNDPIAHLDTMQEIHNVILHMETTLNMAVRFWKVSREDIAGADGLAQSAMRTRSHDVEGLVDTFLGMGV